MPEKEENGIYISYYKSQYHNYDNDFLSLPPEETE